MANSIDKQQLIEMVSRVLRSEYKNQKELRQLFREIDQRVPAHSGYVMDLIFYPTHYGLGETPTAAEIVEKALSYQIFYL
jgi:hypothetical protein